MVDVIAIQAVINDVIGVILVVDVVARMHLDAVFVFEGDVIGILIAPRADKTSLLKNYASSDTIQGLISTSHGACDKVVIVVIVVVDVVDAIVVIIVVNENVFIGGVIFDF